MAFDGACIHHICRELSEAIGAHVEKIQMPAREDVLLALKWKGGSGKLLLTANAGSPRIHFTSANVENPASPPMFCMLLRKHLNSARLTDVRQIGLERIVYLDFDTVNEIGDPCSLTLAVEIMGRHSNIILFDRLSGKIIDAVKRVDGEMSSVRQVLPGMLYTLPPAQDCTCILDGSQEDTLRAVLEKQDLSVQKAVIASLQGFSPLLAREAAFVAGGSDMPLSQLPQSGREALESWLADVCEKVRNCSGVPTMLLDEEGKPADFSFISIRQYGTLRTERTYGDFSSLLDAFYRERTQLDRMKQRSRDLLTTLQNARDRAVRKVAVQKEELETSRNREELKLKAELITANIYMLKKGMTSARVVNYYDPEQTEIEIPLDGRLSPIENAQKLYTEYRKAANAEQMLVGLIEKGEEQVAYLDSVLDEVTRSQGESELAEIRRELAETGYVKRRSLDRGKPVKVPPLKYISDDGFVILVGRNNLQNDRLTCKDAARSDVWMHVQKIHGSHVIVVSDGQEIPDSTLTQAAILAAYHSQARASAQVPVDYTFVRYVKKPQGAAPGKVIYTDYRTAYVEPDAALADRLAAKR